MVFVDRFCKHGTGDSGIWTRVAMRFSRLFLWLVIAYVVSLVLKQLHIQVHWLFSSYFADLLSLPILLTMSVHFIRQVQHKDDFLLDWPKVLFVWAYQSIVFEYFLPLKFSKFTSDPYDLVAYALGAVLFLIYQKKLTKSH